MSTQLSYPSYSLNDLEQMLDIESYHTGNGEHPQSRCFAENPDAELYLSYQPSKTNRYYMATSIADFMKLPMFVPEAHWYEIIRPGSVKMYFDIDSAAEIDIDSFLEVVKSLVPKPHKFKVSDMVIQTAHGIHRGMPKWSYHFIYGSSWGFASNDDQRDWVNSHKAEFEPFGVDFGVYTKNRCMRTFGSTKYGETRFIGDASIITRTKRGQLSAKTKKELTRRLISASPPTKLFKWTAQTKAVSNGQQIEANDEVIEIMKIFADREESRAFSSSPKCVKVKDDGLEIVLNREIGSFCNMCMRKHDQDTTAYIWKASDTKKIFLKCYRKVGASVYLFGGDGLSQKAKCKIIDVADLPIILGDMTKAFEEIGKLFRYNKKYCSRYAKLMASKAKILASRAPMGTGKTNCAAQKMDTNVRNLIVSFRITLTGQYKNDKFKNLKDLVAYNEKDEDGKTLVLDDKIRNLICQPESFHRIKWTRKGGEYDMIIDEADQVIRQLTSSTFRKQPCAQHSFKSFMQMVRGARQVHIMSANLRASHVKFFQDIKGVSQDDTEIYWNQRNHFKDRKLVIVGHPAEVFMLANEALKRRERIYFAHNGAVVKIHALAELLRKSRDDVRILEVTRDTLDSPEVIAAMSNPSETWGQYDCVLVSPSIQSGISFDLPNVFHHVFGSFGNCTNTSDDASQMLNRIRHPISKNIIIGVHKSNNNIGPTTEEGVMAELQANTKHLREFSQLTEYELDEDMIIRLKKKEFLRLYLRNEAERNKNLSKFDTELVKQHLINGFTVSREVTNKDKWDDTRLMALALKEMVKAIKLDDATKMSQVAELTQEQLKVVQKKIETQSVTKDEMTRLKKTYTLQAYGKCEDDLAELDDDEKAQWFLKYGDPKTRKLFAHQSRLAEGFDEALVRLKREELAKRKDQILNVHDPEKQLTKQEVLSREAFNFIEAGQKCSYGRWSVLVGWLTTIGFESLFDEDGIKRSDVEAACEQIRDNVENIEELACLLGKPLNRMKGIMPDASVTNIVRFINGSLDSEFGLTIKGNRRKKPSRYLLSRGNTLQFEGLPHEPYLMSSEMIPRGMQMDDEDCDSDDEDAINPFI